MQRKDCGLERQADRNESGCCKYRSLVGDFVDPILHVGEIQGAGHHVDQADADQVKRRTDRAHDQVFEDGRQRATIGSAGDQHIARERRNLHEDEDVERVAGDDDAGQAGEREQPRCKEERLAFGFYCCIEALSPAGQRERGSARDDQEQQRAKRVDPQFNAIGRRP